MSGILGNNTTSKKSSGGLLGNSSPSTSKKSGGLLGNEPVKQEVKKVETPKKQTIGDKLNNFMNSIFGSNKKLSVQDKQYATRTANATQTPDTTPKVSIGKANQLQITPRKFNGVDAALLGAVDSASLGIVPRLAGIKDMEKELPTGYKGAYTAGKVLGYVAPATGISKGVSAGLKVVKNPLLNRLAEGAITGGIMTGTEDTAKGKSLKETGKDIAVNTALGGGIDLGLYGLGKGVQAIAKNKAAKSLLMNQQAKRTAEQSLIKSTPKTEIAAKVSNSIEPQQQSLLPEFTKVKQEVAASSSALKEPPKVNTPGKDQEISKFYKNSLMQGNALTDEGKKALNEVEYIYNIKHNEDSLNRATEALTRNGVENEAARLMSNGLNSAEDSMSHYLVTKELQNQALKTGDYTFLNNYLESTRPSITNAGQTIQALSQFKKMTPEGALSTANNVVSGVVNDIKKTTPRVINEAEKEINKLPKDINYAKAKEKILEKYGVPYLSNEDSKFITETMDKVQDMPEGREKDIAVAKVKQLIINKIPSTLVEKSRAWRNISLLGNIKTNDRNILGNALEGVSDNLSNFVGGTVLKPLDKYMSKTTGMESVGIPSLKIQGKGMINGIKTGVSDSLGGLTASELKGKPLNQKLKLIYEGALNPIDTSNLKLDKFEAGRKLAFKSKPLKILENAVNTSLRVGDQGFSQAYYDDVINQLKKVNKTEVVTDEMKDIAKQIAAERTYQDNNTITAMMEGIKKIPTEKIHDNPALQHALQIAFDSVLPYTKTPSAILKRGIENTPVGIIEGLVKLGRNTKNGTLDLAKQREIIDRISRGIVGTGIMTGGTILAKKGLATGAAPDDKDAANFNKMIGKQANSIKIGNKYYDYSQLQPVSMPFGAGVQITQDKKNNSSNRNAILSAGANALNFYADQPMLQSAQRLLGNSYGSEDTATKILNAALELPNQFVPTALKQNAQMKDANQRVTYDKDPFKNTINTIQSKIPGLSQKLQPKIDTFGNPVLNYQGKNNFFNVAANPINSTEYKTDKVADMVDNVYKETGSNTIFPRVAAKTITINRTKYTLTPEQYTEYQKILGQQTYGLYSKYANSEYFNNYTPEQKQKALEKALDKSNDIAKKKMLPILKK